MEIELIMEGMEIIIREERAEKELKAQESCDPRLNNTFGVLMTFLLNSKKQ
ncbi:hypothetical protein X474_27395 [Dethiosulfatarculus sandiegensis]|uniref:Uncharacterized protein n=1 Tax=Dethiosulfatarculus sandiegensis TaxID=1429043 RepID=A0A0D2JNI1_9BACT|nr:hypothetical protein X474_27395 [Dethiosulfatarculus sandiegensis]